MNIRTGEGKLQQQPPTEWSPDVLDDRSQHPLQPVVFVHDGYCSPIPFGGAGLGEVGVVAEFE